MRTVLTIIFALTTALIGCNFEEEPSNPPPVGSATENVETMTSVTETNEDSGSTGLCEETYSQYNCRGFVAGVYQHPLGNTAFINLGGEDYVNCLDFDAGIDTCGVYMGEGIDFDEPDNDTELDITNEILAACEAKCQARVAAAMDGYNFPNAVTIGGTTWTLVSEECVFEHNPLGCTYEDPTCGAAGICDFIEGSPNQALAPEQVELMGPCPTRQDGEDACPAAFCLLWNPVTQTQFTGGSTPKANVDDDFFAALFDNPTKLVECDAGRFVQHDSAPGGTPEWWSLEGLVSGDFFYEIGMRSGDRDVSIKIGSTYYPLDTSDHMMQAFDALGSTSTFKIKYKRGGAWQAETAVSLIECGSNCPNP